MKIIILRDEGIIPGEDCTFALNALLEANPKDTEFVFEEGNYYFSPLFTADYRLSNTEVIPKRTLGILMKCMENVVLSGNGAHLMYSGKMQPITIDRCKNVEINDFVIDWEKPLVAEGTVAAFGEGYVDMLVDNETFPHRVKDGWLEFDTGNNEWYALAEGSQIQFDSQTRTVRRNTADNFCPTSVCELENGLLRFTADNIDTAVGNIFVLRHNERDHAGIFAEKSENVTVSDVTVHSCGGLGCLAQFCRDITFRRVDFLPNTAAGRKVSCGRDDGMHITCCSGTVTITECSFVGLMDDPINVHSCCVNGEEWVDDRTIRCRYMHPQACGFKYWAESGDEIAVLSKAHMNELYRAEITDYELESDEVFLLRFASPVPEEILSLDPKELALDDMTHTASFICTKNRFGSCRARGVLVSVPHKVLIADNLFQSSGSAILVAGDSNYWYESGACHDVEICGNVFTDACLSSMYQFCEGIVSICPVVPKPDVDKPYHTNIRIHHNVFDTPGTPVLYGFATQNLEFTENRIFASPSADKWHPADSLVKLRSCSDVTISDNTLVGAFSLKGIDTRNCKSVTGNILL